MEMNSKTPETDQWQDCQPGELNTLVGRLKSQQKRNSVKQAVSATAAFTLLVVAGFFILNQGWFDGGGEVQAAITCGDVIECGESYINGELDAAKEKQVREHLTKCPHCQARIDQLRSSKTGREAEGETGLVEPAAGPSPSDVTSNIQGFSEGIAIVSH